MSAAEVHLPGVLSNSDAFSVFVSFAVLYLATVLVTHVYSAYFGPLSRFPGPKSHALSILPWIRTQWTGDENKHFLALHKQYGEVVRIRPDALSFIGNAATWKGIYGFKKSGERENPKDSMFYGRPINRVPSLIAADGPTHARQRKIVSHAFSDKALKEQEPMLKMWAGKMKALLMEKAASSTPLDMVRAYNYTTFDIMGDLTFAEPLYMLDNSDYVPWVKTIFASIKHGTRIRVIKMFSNLTRKAVEEILFQVPALRRKLTEHWKYTTDRVDRRLAKTPDRPDLWSRILEKGGDPRGPDAHLSLEEHRSIASLFMFAGTETTATALSGVTFHLLRNPQYMDKLKQELRCAFTTIDDMHLESLAKLPILDATLKEGIRMYPPVPTGLPRRAPPGGVMIGEYFVPEGTSISVHQFSTYRQEENFRHAYEFRPERWLGDPDFKNDNFDSFEPFSTGPRNCLGKNLAWHEMRLLLATTLLYFDLELCEESQNWADQRVYTLWEKPNLMCKLTAVQS